jgi:hypothetical protein
MTRFILSAALALTLSGCAATPSATERASADYGRPITQGECEKIARENILPKLKDPSSAGLSFGQCQKRARHSIPIFGIPKQYGYFIPVTVNAKNSFGGYTGQRLWTVLIRDGRAIRRTYPDQGGQIPY